MTDARQKLARWGEEFAALYLQQRGYTVLERNARTPYGEIDLVATVVVPTSLVQPGEPQIQPVTVFVEVKTRRSAAYGYPEEAITRQKRAHMLAAAQAYLQAHPGLSGDWQIDVMAIFRPNPDQPPAVTYFENVIQDA
jgi:putative endonuclease